MKKIIGLCVLGGMIATAGTAQIKKGTILLGGQLGGGNSKVESSLLTPDAHNSKSSYFSISGGTAIADNKVLGLYGGYASSSYTYLTNSESLKNNFFNAGVFYRQYKSVGKKFYIFGEAQLGYFHSTQKVVYNNIPTITGTTKTNGVQLSFTPGVSYQICKKLQVELTIPSLLNFNYQSAKLKFNNTTETSKSTSFNADLTTQPSILNNIGIGFKFTL